LENLSSSKRRQIRKAKDQLDVQIKIVDEEKELAISPISFLRNMVFPNRLIRIV